MTLTSIMNLSCMSFCLLITFLVWGSFQATAISAEGSFGPSNTSSLYGLCASSVVLHGYKCEEFPVTTEDGYILTVQRIPEGRSRNAGEIKRPPVILQHGVLVDGTTWLINRPDENLPFILADNGFDVWIINGRGTKYSQRHVSLSIYDSRYWDWTWDELAAFELPAVVNFVNNQTGQKAHYIGHSQGTLTALLSLSEGRLVDKLNSATLLSPIAYLNSITTQLGAIAARTFLDQLPVFAYISEFDPLGGPVRLFMEFLCLSPWVNCFDPLAALTGNNCCLNKAKINLFVQNEPQPTSVKNMVHFAQSVRTGVVAKYDYGFPALNMQHYQQPTPPLYNISNIPRDFPLFLSYGALDALSDVQDVQHLLNELKSHDPNKLTVQLVDEYAHLDFIMGTNANSIVYGEVVKFLRRW